MVREVASKTSDTAGDGTTAATVLAQAIVREDVKQAPKPDRPGHFRYYFVTAKHVAEAIGRDPSFYLRIATIALRM
jgi:hypothetical protein